MLTWFFLFVFILIVIAVILHQLRSNSVGGDWMDEVYSAPDRCLGAVKDLKR